MSRLTAEYDSVNPPILASLPSRGFLSRYVQYAMRRTDAPPNAHVAMAVGILSALAGPRPSIPIATSPRGWRLTLWIMYVVNSTTGRKTTVIELAKSILTAVLGQEAIVEWEGSPQGLIQKLQERDGHATVFVRDEFSGLLQQMNRGGHMAGLEQMFIRAFDGNVLENIRTRKKDRATGEVRRDTDRVESPYLVKLTGTTWDAFTLLATNDNVLNGFLPRFIFVTGAATPRALEKTTPEMEKEQAELINVARVFHSKAQHVDRIDVEDEVLKAHWRLEQDWERKVSKSSRPSAAAPSVKRLAESVLKVAALLAIEESVEGEPSISLSHYAAAESLGERWLDDTLRLVETLGATTFQRDTDTVLATVNQHPEGIKLSDLYYRHRRLRKRDFDEILAALETQRRIERDVRQAEGKGRRAIVIKPSSHSRE